VQGPLGLFSSPSTACRFPRARAARTHPKRKKRTNSRRHRQQPHLTSPPEIKYSFAHFFAHSTKR